MLKLPNIEGLLGDQFFNLPANRHDFILRIAAATLQMIGILLFLKWFGVHGKEDHIRLYKKFEPVILIFLIILTPMILNAAIDSTVKAYVYAGKSGSDAVEYVQAEHPCTFEARQKLAVCAITLKNYNHHSQKVLIKLNWEGIKTKSKTTVYLLKHQEKTVYLNFPFKQSEFERLGSIVKTKQPQISFQ